ncbi:MAG: nucleotidyltransferase [Syntrophaceae bacterium]|nr:nucleotidyltransferase [Syntrophaceae bacterium]
MNIKTIFRSLIGFFEQAQIDYALVGSFALKAYGYLRATQDVDFLVRSPHQSRIIAYLESLGYETIYRSVGYSNHVHPLTNLGRIDFIYVEGETADVILSEAKPLLVLDDISVPVVRAEHLIALKVFAMKNDPERSFREMADLQYLLKLPGLDMEEIRGYFEKYGQMEKYDELTKKKKEKHRP